MQNTFTKEQKLLRANTDEHLKIASMKWFLSIKHQWVECFLCIFTDKIFVSYGDSLGLLLQKLSKGERICSAFSN